MKKNRVLALLMSVGLLLASVSVVAHHSVSAEFDTIEEGYLHRNREEDRLDEPSHLHPR